MVFEKLTSADRLLGGAPLLLTAFIVHSLGLASGLAALKIRALRLRAAQAGDGAAGARAGTAEVGAPPLPWNAGEATLLVVALPIVWWIGFILGPEEPGRVSLVNTLGEPLLVAAIGVGYLALRRLTERLEHALAVHFALLAAALAAAGLLGSLLPLV